MDRALQLPGQLGENNSKSDHNRHRFDHGTTQKDPLKLPYDVYAKILSNLSPRDIVRFERVSSWWGKCIIEWVPTTGYRQMLETVWYEDPMRDPEEKRLSYEQLKQYLGQIYHMQIGRVSPSCIIRRPVLFCARGDLIVWTEFDRFTYTRHPNVKENDDISWRLTTSRTTQTVSAGDIFPVDDCSVIVARLQANNSAMLLIRLEVDRVNRKSVRAAVYSLRERKVLWYRDYDTPKYWPDESAKGDIKACIPFLLGESAVYTATWKEDVGSYVLEAYDFRTGERLYESSVLLASWFRGHEVFERHKWANVGHSKVIEAAPGEEVILQFRHATPTTAESMNWTGLDVIQGNSGNLLRTKEP